MNRPYVLISVPELRKRLRVLATAGLSDDEIARAYLLKPPELRERFGEELKAGRADREPPRPGKARKLVWSEPARSRTAMAAQTAWLRAQMREAPRWVAPDAAKTGGPRGRQREKTGAEHLEDWNNGNKEAAYALSDEVLEDTIREGRARKAARQTSHYGEAVGRNGADEDEDEDEDEGVAGKARDEETDPNEAPSSPIPPGTRPDEIFADVVHDGPKKVGMHPDRWSKGEVLDYLIEEEFDELSAKRSVKHPPPSA